MTVIQVIPSVSAESSGPSYCMTRMMRVLGEMGVNVELCTLDNFPSRWNRFPHLGVSPAMYRRLRHEAARVDIIHNNSLWMMPNVYPYWAARDKSVKVVTSPHGTLSKWALNHGKYKKMLFGMLLQYPALRRTDMWHATCEKEYGEIRAAGYKQPVAIIPIGVDLPNVKGREDGSARRKVVFLGRLHKVKAVDKLICAWEDIAENFPNWDLEIAGPDGGVRDELEAMVCTRNIPRIKFNGEISGFAKYEFLSSADIYVLPSHTENFAVTVAEALACRTPVIASYGTPWSELNEIGAGWWIPIGAQPLARQLERAMSLADSERAAMGARGREWIAREFNWKLIGMKMQLAYEWIINPVGTERPEYIRTE